jgi:hypothetical protein
VKSIYITSTKMATTGIAVGINKGFPVEKITISRPSQGKGVSE